MIAVRTLSVLAGALGLFLAYVTITGVTHQLGDDRPRDGLVMDIVFGAIGASAAIWFMASAYRAWRKTANPPVRSLSAIVALVIWTKTGRFLEGSVQHFPGLTVDVWRSILLFGAVLLACAVYVGLTWWFFSTLKIGHTWFEIPPFVIVVLCLYFWMMTSDLLWEVLPKEPRYERIPRFPWGLVAIFAPMVMAISIGKMLSRLRICRDKENGTFVVVRRFNRDVV